MALTGPHATAGFSTKLRRPRACCYSRAAFNRRHKIRWRPTMTSSSVPRAAAHASSHDLDRADLVGGQIERDVEVLAHVRRIGRAGERQHADLLCEAEHDLRRGLAVSVRDLRDLG